MKRLLIQTISRENQTKRIWPKVDTAKQLQNSEESPFFSQSLKSII